MAVRSENPILDRLFYERAAREYCESLPLEHFMESTPAATQRKITLESFDLVHAARPDVWCYNELLIQYPVAGIRDIGRVGPDNLVVVHNAPIRGTGSFNTPFEDTKPFMALEYVSEGTERKDYVDNMRRYERDLKVPYYLLFEPDKKQVVLFKLPAGKKKYASVRPNRDDRLAVPELELEAGMLDDWVRFWFRGKLLPLPAELAAELAEAKKRLRQAERRAEAAEAELERLRAELKRLKGNGGRSG
jgi:hypothetical protein